jgi:hypothetical protein
MNSADNSEKSRLESLESSLDAWMYVGMLFVLIGVIGEALPDFLSSNPTFILVVRRIGESLVALGLLVEFIVDIRLRKTRSGLKVLADKELEHLRRQTAQAEQATAEANLGRVRIEEALFKPHVLMSDASKQFLEIINAYRGKKRVDVFVYDHHIGDVRVLADSINATFLVAGWNSKMWIGAEPRLVGSEVAFCVPHEDRQLQELAGRLMFVLHRDGIGSSTSIGEISSKLPLKPLGGWGIWDPNDVPVFRVQVGQRQLSSELLTRAVVPPQT